MPLFDINDIIEQLVVLWQSRIDESFDYFKKTYGLPRPSGIFFNKLLITQLRDGNIDSCSIDLFNGIAKWIVDDLIINRVPLDYPWFDVTNPSGEYYITPMYNFFLQDRDIILSETFGPSIVHRLKGKIVIEDERLIINWSTVWCTPEP